MKQCFGYVRVSTVKQGDGVSLEEQKASILEFAQRKNLVVCQWWEEKETASKQGRPVFNKMVSELKRGGATGLIVHKIDRSARNYHDWDIIGDLADNGIDIHIATESFDFNTYGGRMAADFMQVVAANYGRNLKNEVRKGQLGQLKRGMLPWSAPIGYINNGKRKLKTPDPVFAPLVALAFKIYADGNHPIRALIVEMERRGLRTKNGRPLSKGCMEKLLSNPFYCGIILVKRSGLIFDGAHKPIITPALFKRVQDIKSGRTAKKLTRHNHLFRGLLGCENCSNSLYGELHKGRVYYRCHTPSCPITSLREDQIEQTVIELLSGLRLPTIESDQLHERLSKLIGADGAEKAMQSLKLQIAKVKNRLNKLTDLLLDDLIDSVVFQDKKQALLIEQKDLEIQLAEGEGNRADPDNVVKFLELANSLAQLYISAAKEQKRRIVQWATLNRRVTEKSLCLEPSKWLLDTQNMLSVLYCAHDRPNSRTFDPSVLSSFDDFELSKNEFEPSIESWSKDTN